MIQVSKDPKQIYPKPPYPHQSQEWPGLEKNMEPRPDYGRGKYKGTGKLYGKVALITGGDSGIGRAVAYAYAAEGAEVVISYLNETEDANETVEAIREAGKEALAIAGDIQREEHCKMLVDKTIEKFGKIDILVNNAAFQKNYESIVDISTEEFDQHFKTNIYAMFWLCKYALPHLKEGGSIICTASIQAYTPSPSLLPYASTKAAIVNFVKGLAPEAMKKGIRVNAVAPGPVWTPFIVSTMGKNKIENFGDDTLLKRAAQPVEMSPVFVFLASDEATAVTTHVYGATNGELFP